MKRGYFIIAVLVACIFQSRAQSTMDFVLNREGKVTAVPKFKQFDFNIPEFSYKTYSVYPDGTGKEAQGIYPRLPSPGRRASDGYASIISCLPSFL